MLNEVRCKWIFDLVKCNWINGQIKMQSISSGRAESRANTRFYLRNWLFESIDCVGCFIGCEDLGARARLPDTESYGRVCVKTSNYRNNWTVRAIVIEAIRRSWMCQPDSGLYISLHWLATRSRIYWSYFIYKDRIFRSYLGVFLLR